jgi:hypothetical protein
METIIGTQTEAVISRRKGNLSAPNGGRNFTQDNLEAIISREDKQYAAVLSSFVDPDPHGSKLIWLSGIRIRIRNADPDPGALK